MFRSSKLPAFMMALCLLFSLAGLAETAAEPVSWPLEQLGGWVGYHQGSWKQYTFYPGGRYDVMDFEDPSRDRFGTAATYPKSEGISLTGAYLQLAANGERSYLKHIKTPYIRLHEADEKAGKYVDPDLIGTYGGRRNNAYIEWTFDGYGRFTQIIPYKAAEGVGEYTAGGGEAEIILNQKTMMLVYEISKDTLRMKLPGGETLILKKKSGQLHKMLVDEDFVQHEPGFGQLFSRQDFGWILAQPKLTAWAFTRQEPAGWIACRYLGSQSEVGMPSALDGLAVVGIGDEVFKDYGRLTSISIPLFVTRIGKAAFEGCESLGNVLLINTWTDTGYPYYEPDFYIYESLGISTIPDSCPLKTIGDNAFRGCVSLKDLNIADSASQSPYSIFWWIGHSDRSGVNIPDGVTTIGAHAFDGCVSIESMTIPDSVTRIGEGAFDSCPVLTLMASEGSYAHQYAQDNGLCFEIAAK